MLLDLMKRERGEGERKGRPSQDICSHSFIFLCFFTSFRVLLLLFQCAFHLFDRWATFVAIERDLEVCVITGSRMGTASGGVEEKLQRHMKAKMKRDPVDPGIRGWKEGGWGGRMKAWAQREAGS